MALEAREYDRAQVLLEEAAEDHPDDRELQAVLAAVDVKLECHAPPEALPTTAVVDDGDGAPGLGDEAPEDPVEVLQIELAVDTFLGPGLQDSLGPEDLDSGRELRGDKVARANQQGDNQIDPFDASLHLAAPWAFPVPARQVSLTQV